MADQIISDEVLLSTIKKSSVINLLNKLIYKNKINHTQNFETIKILKAHALPLICCTFNKSGDSFLSSSFEDRKSVV